MEVDGPREGEMGVHQRNPYCYEKLEQGLETQKHVRQCTGSTRSSGTTVSNGE